MKGGDKKLKAKAGHEIGPIGDQVTLSHNLFKAA
jgi:hypothetical protein